jgi:hypothetical protein
MFLLNFEIHVIDVMEAKHQSQTQHTTHNQEVGAGRQSTSAQRFMSDRKGETSVGFVMAIVVLTIIISSVAIPIVNEATANVSGTEGTILNIVSVLLVTLVVTMIASRF